MTPDRHLGSLLGRWHQWRRAYSPERGYARVPHLGNADPEDTLERITMLAVEEEIESMPRDMQLALQHVARAECMGVEVFTTPRLGNTAEREVLVQTALKELQRRLLRCGIL